MLPSIICIRILNSFYLGPLNRTHFVNVSKFDASQGTPNEAYSVRQQKCLQKNANMVVWGNDVLTS